MYYSNISHGGLLQAYSLCEKIKALGFDCEQIKYDYNERFRAISPINKCKHYIRKLPKRLLMKVVRDCSKEKYFSYMDEVPHSRLYLYDDMTTINDDYDIFVVGSDQVWNDLYCDDYFYFPDVKKKKISYAASVGKDNLSKDELLQIANKIKDFSAVSVREKSLQIMLQEQSLRRVDLVCDPVFLNDYNFWASHAHKPEIDDKYLLVYLLGEDKKQKINAINLAKTTGLKVVTVPNVNLNASFKDLHASDIVCWSVGPKDFLGLIKNADYILTDSFHCVAFSIIFNKNFYCFDRGGKEKKMNSRLKSVLDILGISNRFIELDCFDSKNMKEIDYNMVSQNLSEYKKESENWLKNALSR